MRAMTVRLILRGTTLYRQTIDKETGEISTVETGANPSLIALATEKLGYKKWNNSKFPPYIGGDSYWNPLISDYLSSEFYPATYWGQNLGPGRYAGRDDIYYRVDDKPASYRRGLGTPFYLEYPEPQTLEEIAMLVLFDINPNW